MTLHAINISHDDGDAMQRAIIRRHAATAMRRGAHTHDGRRYDLTARCPPRRVVYLAQTTPIVISSPHFIQRRDADDRHLRKPGIAKSGASSDHLIADAIY